MLYLLMAVTLTFAEMWVHQMAGKKVAGLMSFFIEPCT
jgi:hypothetical protein